MEGNSFCFGEFCFVVVAAEVILSVCSMVLINQMFQPKTLNTWADIYCSESVWPSLEWWMLKIWGKTQYMGRGFMLHLFFKAE